MESCVNCVAFVLTHDKAKQQTTVGSLSALEFNPKRNVRRSRSASASWWTGRNETRCLVRIARMSACSGARLSPRL